MIPDDQREPAGEQRMDASSPTVAQAAYQRLGLNLRVPFRPRFYFFVSRTALALVEAI
jgi:hypothetical protein